MAKILVTGGAGFIGSYVVDSLIEKGCCIRVLDDLSGGYMDNVNPKAEFIEGDIRGSEACDKAVKDVDLIMHIAAHAAEGQSVFTPIYNAQVDYIGSLTLLVSAINEGVKAIVFTSSMARYGKVAEPPFTEAVQPKPEDPYGMAKIGFENLLRIYSHAFGFKYAVIVPHNIYGPRQNIADPYRNVIAIWMNRILHGKPPMIYGDGLQTRAFGYVEDIAPYIAKAGMMLRNGPSAPLEGQAINIGGEEVVTIKKLADLVLESMKSDLKPIYRPARPQEVKHAYCDHSKAAKLLGYQSRTSLKDGLEKMAAWAKVKGPQTFKYWQAPFEITRRIPRVWRLKEL